MIALIAFLAIGSSCLLSGMESGVFALNRLRIRQLARHGDPRARVLHGFLQDAEGFLWTILVGNTLANCVVVGLWVWILGSADRLHAVARAVVFFAGVFLFYLFCDLAPKMLFRNYPNRLCLMLARPFRWVHRGLAPLVWLVTWLTRALYQITGGRLYTGRTFANREDLRAMIRDSATGLSSEERSMIAHVFDLQKFTVGHTMTPWERVNTVDLDTPMGEVRERCRRLGLTRVPVVETAGGRRRVVGLLTLKRVLYEPGVMPDHLASMWMQPAQFLGEELRLDEALRSMQRSGHRLAIVLRPDGQEAGVISLQDILGVVFGKVSL